MDALPKTWPILPKLPLLSREDVAALSLRIRQGDEEALQTLVNHNLRLVLPLVKPYQSNGMPAEDVVQNGVVALYEAAKRFNPTFGTQFSTYAYYWIRRELREAYRRGYGPLVRVPHATTPACKRQAAIARRHYMTLTEGITTLPVFTSSEKTGEENTLAALDRLAIREAISHLDARSQDVILSLYGFDTIEAQTFKEISQRWGVSRERIRQLEEKALAKLKILLADAA
jgi:RNA polymerase primary sigma factor